MSLRYSKIRVLILLFAAAISCGCGTFSNMKKSTGKMVRDFKAPDTDLKKTVFRAGLNNQVATAQQDMGAVIDSRYLETLSQACPDLFLTGSENLEASQALNLLFQKSAGPADSLTLIRIGKQLGISAVVSSRFSAIAVRQQDSGFLWLRKKLPFAWVSATTEVYDTETGAKYLDETFTRELKLTDETAEDIRKGNVSSVPAVEAAVFEIIQEMADAVCDAIIRKPWKGYVAKVTEETLTLSSGSRSGLSAGRMLKVYEPGQRIKGSEGQTFLLPGKKIGEIRITTVFSDSAEAVATSGGGFQVDNVVKTK
ncbi:MAG: hypothetical protein V1844_13815 [Pseudomonadota bacterium]